jgi:hypothetical protein
MRTAEGWTVALCGLLLASSVGRAVSPQTPAPAARYRLSGPYVHANLTIFLIHGEDQLHGKVYLTLPEALAQKKVIVHETGNVNQLTIENVSSIEVIVQAGDIVKGGQQDRVIGFDLIVPPKSGRVPLASFCVEHGRWTRRGREDVVKFETSNNQAATKELKLAIRSAKAQGEVWHNVDRAQRQLSENVGRPVQAPESRSSLQLTLENKTVEELTKAYLDKLASVGEGKADVIGYAYAINGTVAGAEIYAGNSLFRKAWPILLRSSAIEALAADRKAKSSPAVTATVVQKFLTEAEKGKATAENVSSRVRLIQHETDKAVLFESCDQQLKGKPFRCSYVAK